MNGPGDFDGVLAEIERWLGDHPRPACGTRVAPPGASERALTAHMGRPIATVVRTAAELHAVVDANPFAAVATAPAHLCVTFLSRTPTTDELAPLRQQAWAPERVHVAGKHIYLASERAGAEPAGRRARQAAAPRRGDSTQLEHGAEGRRAARRQRGLGASTVTRR